LFSPVAIDLPDHRWWRSSGVRYDVSMVTVDDTGSLPGIDNIVREFLT